MICASMAHELILCLTYPSPTSYHINVLHKEFYANLVITDIFGNIATAITTYHPNKVPNGYFIVNFFIALVSIHILHNPSIHVGKWASTVNILTYPCSTGNQIHILQHPSFFGVKPMQHTGSMSCWTSHFDDKSGGNSSGNTCEILFSFLLLWYILTHQHTQPSPSPSMLHPGIDP